MKKFIPLLFVSSATLYSTILALPVTANGCTSSPEKTELICSKGDNDCEKTIIENRIN